jgi:glyoxylase-like metal-dependent hydrolase (beta-lactamase superfamily II)
MGVRSQYLRPVQPERQAEGPLQMDYFVWTVQSPEHTIVVDTGFDPVVGERRRRTCLTAPASLLAAVGVDPAAVETVVLTHLHYDHIGNLAAFPRASFVVHRRELEFWSSRRAKHPEFAALIEPQELSEIDAAADAGRILRIDRDTELAPGVLALWTGGHSPGQLIVVVRSAGSIIVLASDALHFYEELDGDVTFAFCASLEEARAGYGLLRDLAARDAEIVAGHDPRVLDRFPRLEGELSELGVRVV